MDILSSSSIRLSPKLAAVLLPSWLTGNSLWLNLLTVLLFALGVALTLRRETQQIQALTGARFVPPPQLIDKIIPFGRTFFAVPLALFGMQHFAFLNEVKGAVPSWMPWHIFWTCLVGIALIAACLSILTDIKASLAALLVGIMLFLFVLMISLPAWVGNPRDPSALTFVLRDLALSGGALALAGTPGIAGFGQRTRWLAQRPELAPGDSLAQMPWPMNRWLVNFGRIFFAVPMVYFGVEHFLHPEYAPGVPFEKLMPLGVPAHMVWAYAMGAVLLVCGGCIVANRGARAAAACLGVAFLLLVVFLYLPMEIVHPSIAISGELDDLVMAMAMCGAALLVAGALASKSVPAQAPSLRIAAD